MSDAVKALLNYQQADEDGVMVLVSRQAIHEVVAQLAIGQWYGLPAEEQLDHFLSGLEGIHDYIKSQHLQAAIFKATEDIRAAMAVETVNATPEGER